MSATEVLFPFCSSYVSISISNFYAIPPLPNIILGTNTQNRMTGYKAHTTPQLHSHTTTIVVQRQIILTVQGNQNTGTYATQMLR